MVPCRVVRPPKRELKRVGRRETVFPGPGAYEIVSIAASPAQGGRGTSAFKSNTFGTLLDQQLARAAGNTRLATPGPNQYRPVLYGQRSFHANLTGRWV